MPSVAERREPPLSRNLLEGALAKARALHGAAPQDTARPAAETPADVPAGVPDFVDLRRALDATPPGAQDIAPAVAGRQPGQAEATALAANEAQGTVPKVPAAEAEWNPTLEEAEKFFFAIMKGVELARGYFTLDKDVTVADALRQVAFHLRLPTAPGGSASEVARVLLDRWNKAMRILPAEYRKSTLDTTEEWYRNSGYWMEWLGKFVDGSDLSHEDAFDVGKFARALRTHRDFQGLSPERFTNTVRSIYEHVTGSGLSIVTNEEIEMRIAEREEQVLPERDQRIRAEAEAEIRRMLEEERARSVEAGGPQELPENVRSVLSELHPLVRVLRSVGEEFAPEDIYELVGMAQEKAGVAPDQIIRSRQDYNRKVEQLLAELPQELAYSFRLTFQAYKLFDLAPKE